MNETDEKLSLVEQAKKVKKRNYKASQEDLELILAWLKEDINFNQLSNAYFTNNPTKSRMNVYVFVKQCIEALIEQRKIIFID